MRHNRVVARREHRRAFRRAFTAAALTTAAAAALGHAIAYSALSGWAAVGVAGAVAATVWVESRHGRHFTAPPVRALLVGRPSGDD